MPQLTLEPSLIDGQPRVYDNLHSALRYDYRFAHVVADLSLLNDQKYSPYEVYTLGRYFFVNAGGMVLDFGVLQVSGGRLPHRDLVDSPYSLFISSRTHPAILADITFRGGPFTYETRWVRLNTHSSAGYPDRGANYKVFAVQLGDWRFGLQDSGGVRGPGVRRRVLLQPHSPHRHADGQQRLGKPWAENGNDNSIMGLFVERQRPESYLYAQWLVDDINLDFLIPDFLRDEFRVPQIPQQDGLVDRGALGPVRSASWASTTPAPRSSPSQALEPDNPYSYTYYPDVEYKLKDPAPAHDPGRGGQLHRLPARGEQHRLPGWTSRARWARWVLSPPWNTWSPAASPRPIPGTSSNATTRTGQPTCSTTRFWSTRSWVRRPPPGPGGTGLSTPA